MTKNRNTTTSRGEAPRQRSSRQNRRGRNNPSRHPVEPVGVWEADIKLESHGAKRADMKRKVKTNGIRKIDAADLFDEALLLLRRGYEVRLTTERDGEVLRLYPCLDADYREMFVAAMTMGAFRHSLSDIRFRMQKQGREADPGEESVTKAERAQVLRESRGEVTPDTVVTCPKCGAEFRVGQRISK